MRRALAVAWLCAITLPGAGVAARGLHPLHSSVLELTVDRDRRELHGRLRAFADDLGRVAGTTPDALRAYLAAHVAITGPSGAPLPVAWSVPARDGDALVATFALRGVDASARLAVRHAVLSDAFPDQVNLVRVVRDGRSATMLFMPGDGPRPLP
ncbi:MAG: DUF6702 family protein [Gemmatimonadales bacterium]|nr:DUF6702 family protein [Gemmatimonadales bacterium]